MRKSKAFTLAEVLITLVIIGVIAAMTIPTLMGNTNDKEMKVNMKRALSKLSQAAKLDAILYGETDFCEGSQFDMKRRLMNHMSVIDPDGGSCRFDDCTGFTTADGMDFNVYGGCDVDVDLNGKKGNGEYGVDVFNTHWDREAQAFVSYEEINQD